MVNFVRQQTQVSAITRIGGDMELLKDFIAANIPVIVETGYSLEGEDWLGHYQTVVGYDDNQNIFYIYDSWLGMAQRRRHDRALQRFRRATGRRSTAPSSPSTRQTAKAIVQQILGDRADVTPSRSARAGSCASRKRAPTARTPSPGSTWARSYDQAGRVRTGRRRLTIRRFQLDLPFRMLWYQFGPFEAYFETGRYDDVLALVNNNADTAGQLRRGDLLLAGQGLRRAGTQAEATAAFQRALAKNPHYQAARDALNSL